MDDAPNVESVLRRLGYAVPKVKLLADSCINIVLEKRQRCEPRTCRPNS